MSLIFFPDYILLNNDLSSGIPQLLQNVAQRVVPSVKLAWTSRLKSEHFGFYAQVVQDFCSLTQFDQWLFAPLFERCPEVNFLAREGMDCLYRHASQLFEKIQSKYQQYHIEQDPFLVIKADQGTYGMAVMMIKDPEELLSLNRKQRTRMSTLKGGRQVSRVILQEGVPTCEKIAGGEVAEPVIYSIGEHVVGGFYRAHQGRGEKENLNAPGMKFYPMESIAATGQEEQAQRFYVYTVVARLASLAAARELANFCK